MSNQCPRHQPLHKTGTVWATLYVSNHLVIDARPSSKKGRYQRWSTRKPLLSMWRACDLGQMPSHLAEQMMKLQMTLGIVAYLFSEVGGSFRLGSFYLFVLGESDIIILSSLLFLFWCVSSIRGQNTNLCL